MKKTVERFEMRGGVNIAILIFFALIILAIIYFLRNYNVEETFLPNKIDLNAVTPTPSDFKWK